MAKFAFNNAKNASTGHNSFELNYSYYLHIFYKKNVDHYFKSNLANKLFLKL